MVGLVVVPVKNRADWTQVLELRRTVFVEEQGVCEAHEVGKADLTALHVLASRDGSPIGCGRLVYEVDGPLEEPDEAAIHAAHVPRSELAARLPRFQTPEGSSLRGRIGRMAVLPHARGQGVGRHVLAGLEGNAWRAGLTRLVLAAQASAIPFYKKNGYTPVGEPFMEAGIEHLWMEKRKAPLPTATP